MDFANKELEKLNAFLIYFKKKYVIIIKAYR